MPTLDELTNPDAVRQALARFDELGRDEFLRRYGFGAARRFWLVVNGRKYDSKAIAGVAWGFQHANGARWLRSEEFSGGNATVRRKLEELGFSVIDDPGPAGNQTTDAAGDPVTSRADTGPRPKSWIFQANPNAFKISEYLADRPADLLWVVRQKGADMALGDRVFVWRAIGGGGRVQSGVIAEAEIIELPRVQPEDAHAVPFWVEEGGSADPALPQNRVRLRLLRLAEGDDILQRDAVASDPVLARMQVLTGRTGTNFLLKAAEADALTALWSRANTIPIAAGTTADEVAADIAAVEADPGLTDTTRLALVEARRGQGQFRAGLLRRWAGACAVTSVAVAQALRASHMRPWREATNAERLDPSNGLLLGAHLDALFDAGLISFESDGTMLISSALSVADCERLGLPRPLRAGLTAAEQAFMAHHRSAKFRH